MGASLLALLWLGWELLAVRERSVWPPGGPPQTRREPAAETAPLQNVRIPSPMPLAPPPIPREARPAAASEPVPAAATEPEAVVAQDERPRLAQAPRPVVRTMADVLDESRAQLRAALRRCPAPRADAAQQRLMFHYTLVVREGTASVSRLGKIESDLDDVTLERCWLAALSAVRFAVDADPTETQLTETVSLAEVLAAPRGETR
jgi:hypothetical protein